MTTPTPAPASFGTFVKIGEELLPLATMTIDSLIGLAKQHNNTTLVEQLQQLKTNKETIDEDKATVDQELKDLDAEETKSTN